MHSNGNTVLEEKLFPSYESAFELARELWGSQTSKGNRGLGLAVSNYVENIGKHNACSSFLGVPVLSSVICQPIYLFCASCLLVGFKSIRKCCYAPICNS